MWLELRGDESRLLKAALEIRLDQMRSELVHTDARAYRAELRADLDRLEDIAKRLAQGSAGGPTIR